MDTTPSSAAMTLARIAVRAGEILMHHYTADVAVRQKADLSPVTEADEEAERFILASLAAEWPDVAVIAEEEMAAGRIAKAGSRFFLVDPLDGTKEFLCRNGEFTVNIGEIVDAMPVSGAVYAPAFQRLFVGEIFTGKEEGAAFELTCAPGAAPDFAHARRIEARSPPAAAIAAVSRSHRDATTDAFLAEKGVTQLHTVGSSLKFCLVAAGEADLYPRTGATMEWDTAAGHAVLRAAGGNVTLWNDAPLLYAKPGYRNPPFIARGKI